MPDPRPTATAGPLLDVREVACRRGDRLLIHDLSLTLEAGEIVWLRAANGQGKTSLLRILAGLSKPEAGTIASDGRPLLLAHANALKEDLTVAESLDFLVALHGQAVAPERRDEALRRVGLHGRRRAPVRTLSQGQRRRVALARLCFAADQRVWLLDEPFDALDQDGTAVAAALIGEHARDGGTVLLTSHVPVAVPGAAVRELTLDPVAA